MGTHADAGTDNTRASGAEVLRRVRSRDAGRNALGHSYPPPMAVLSTPSPCAIPHPVLPRVLNGRTRPDKMGEASDVGGAWGTYPKYTISMFDLLTKVICRDVLYESVCRSPGSLGAPAGRWARCAAAPTLWGGHGA